MIPFIIRLNKQKQFHLEINLSGSCTCLWHQVLFIGDGQGVGLCPAQLTLWEVGVHFIPVEVSVVSLAVGVVQPEHLLGGQDAGAVRLDGRSVQRGLPVQQQHVAIPDVPTHLPQTSGCCQRQSVPQKGLTER